MSEPTTMYDAVGGEPTFEALTVAFYEQVKVDDIIGPMYPEDDWEGAKDRLKWFLMQYWGGPRTYERERGAPMMRRRHFPYPIDPPAAERWLELMTNALDDVAPGRINDEQRAAIFNHMERMAYTVLNKPY